MLLYIRRKKPITEINQALAVLTPMTTIGYVSGTVDNDPVYALNATSSVMSFVNYQTGSNTNDPVYGLTITSSPMVFVGSTT